MDEIDAKIILHLEENARTPLSQIAKKLRKNRNVIAYRIQNLKKQGLIQEYITSIDLGKLQYTTYKLFFKLNQTNNHKTIINFIKEKKEIISLSLLEGEYALSCVIVTKNVLELDQFLNQTKQKFSNIIDDLHVGIIIYSKIFSLKKIITQKKEKEKKQVKILENTIEKYSAINKKIKLDKKDTKILQTLAKQADMSYIDLAKKTNLSLDIIKYRMKKLKKEVISSFRIRLNLQKIKYTHYVILIKTKCITKPQEETLLTWSEYHKSVLYISKKIGLYDFEINIAIKDLEDLRSFTKELQEQFSNILQSYNTIIISKTIKLNYIPF